MIYEQKPCCEVVIELVGFKLVIVIFLDFHYFQSEENFKYGSKQVILSCSVKLLHTNVFFTFSF